jgi:hypothetical protein
MVGSSIRLADRTLRNRCIVLIMARVRRFQRDEGERSYKFTIMVAVPYVPSMIKPAPFQSRFNTCSQLVRIVRWWTLMYDQSLLTWGSEVQNIILSRQYR